jgi:hypothetical protein
VPSTDVFNVVRIINFLVLYSMTQVSFKDVSPVSARKSNRVQEKI